jgi:peptidoglycan/xylan/chitin deacetylase (PgdA/CDA1 family)
VRGTVKRAAYASGLLGAYHRRRNADTLTVVTFHRVLDEDDERWAATDPYYTVSGGFLRDAVLFFREHYELVDAPAVASACRGDASLPDRALLVTFDDGWADTAECALPVLRELRCPAVVFVTPSVVGSPLPFWQERVFAAWKLGTVGAEELSQAWASAGGSSPPDDWSTDSSVRSLVVVLGRVEPGARAALVEQLAAGTGSSRPQMLTLDQLHELRSAGLELGGHGLSHEPLAGHPGAPEEIRQSRERLSELLGGRPVASMSFPHGSYDEAALAAAQAEYEVVHTSVATLNPTVDGRLTSPVLGRIGIAGEQLADGEGRLRPDLLAPWLFRRPVAAV